LKHIILTIVFLIIPSLATALQLKLNTDIGDNYSGVTLGVSEYYEFDDLEAHISDWQITAASNKSKYLDADYQAQESKGYDFSLGGGIVFLGNYNLAGSIFQTETPSTDYQQKGGLLLLSYANTDHEPSYSVGIGIGGSLIVQDVEFIILSTPIKRTIEIDQSEFQIFASLSIFHWLLIKYQGQSYQYSKDKAELQQAFQSDFLQYYTTDLISSIGGLPEYSNALEFIFTLNQDWGLSLLHQVSHLIVDDSSLYRTELFATRYYKKWNIGFGLSRIGTKSEKDTLALLSIGAEL
jgi:hypothetical protein